MAVKPVKFISDVQTKKQIIKTDISGNVLFAVSGTLPDGSVSSSLPITASGLYIDGNAEIIGTLNARRMHITEVTTSVYYEDSLSASINALQDVSASNAVVGSILQWDGTNWIATSGANLTGSLYGTASHAVTASYALALAPETLSINDLSDVSASSPTLGSVLQWDGTNWVATVGADLSGSFTGSLYGTASYAVSSSYAITAAYALALSGAVLSLQDLTDVSASNVVSGNILRYDGTYWIPDNSLSGIFSGSFSGTLYGDVVGTASNAVTASYALALAPETLSINDLIDVSASNASASQYLKYDGTQWVASDVSGIGVSRQQYIALRYNASGTFAGDTVELELPPEFTTSSIKYISFNLLTRETAGSNWRNDLASVEFKISASAVWAILSAPTQPYEYTFNAVNDNPYAVEQAVIVNEYTDIYVSGNLTVSGAALPELCSPTTEHNVADVLLSINNKFTLLAGLSETRTGSFDLNGSKNIQLNNYTYADLDYVAVDVMVKYNGTGTWKNDLISVELSGNIAADKLHVLLDSPALTNLDYYRIIANKQTGSLSCT